MRMSRIILAVVVGAALGGCTSVGPQVVSGVVELGSFHEAPSSVRVTRAGQIVVESAIDLEGRFSLTIPPGQAYRIELYAPSATPGLVFPRKVGGVDASFTVRGGTTPFDLGMVRYVGDPTARTYAFITTTPTPGVALSTVASGDCEGGMDQSSRAVCVDDDDDEGATVCEEEGDDDGEDHQCEDGIDPATGAECDGGPAANADGSGADGADEALPGDAAVADHNLPAEIGCGDDDEEDDD